MNAAITLLLSLECMQMLDTNTASLPTFSAHELAANTTDAYSFTLFGKRQWFNCALLLAARGFNLPEATAILYSKLMRLAAENRRSADRKATSDELRRFLDESSTQEYLAANLDEYVLNIIGEDLVPSDEPPVKLISRDVLRLAFSRNDAKESR